MANYKMSEGYYCEWIQYITINALCNTTPELRSKFIFCLLLLYYLVLSYCCDITKNSTFFHKCNSGFTSIAKIRYFWTFFFNSQALLKQKIVHFSPNCTFLPNLEHYCTYREISIHHLVSFFFFVSRCLAWKIELFCGSFNGLSEPFNSKWLELVEENSQ